MLVCWATKLRGFLKHLSEGMKGVEFVGNTQYYEVSGWQGKLKSKLIRSRLFDFIGLFQIIKISDKGCDCYGSYNRFLNADKPYFIYLENPTALYHYALGRLEYPLGRKRFSRCISDPNLKYIVCMTDACRNTFERINGVRPSNVRIKTIYPFVPENPYVSDDLIARKSCADVLECLYCVQGKSFYNKGGEDVLEAVARLQNSGLKIHLTVITNSDELDDQTLNTIKANKDISLHEFSFSYSEMERIYSETAVLIHPSSADSCGLTVLEAMKAGCAILSSKLYAFPEMVEQNGNGILIDPKYWTFLPDNMPNPKAWGQKRKARLSKQRSEKYINDIEQALRKLYEERDTLYSFSKRSLEIASTKFGCETICSQWNDVWDSLKGFNEK